MELQPSLDIHAAMDSFEFYRTQKTLLPGTYQVTEHDGEINFATVDRYSNVKWYSRREYDLAIEQGLFEQSRADQLDVIMRCDDDIVDDDDREELMDSWNDAMHRDHDEQPDDYCHGLEVKSLAELLREAMARPDPELNEPTLAGECQKFLNAGRSRDSMQLAVKASGTEVDTSHLTTVFENGVQVNVKSLKEIRELTQRSLNEVMTFGQAPDVVREESSDCYLLRGFNA